MDLLSGPTTKDPKNFAAEAQYSMNLDNLV
jgi:hypothetical protein